MSLRQLRLRVATSQQNIAFQMFLLLQTLRRLLSRLVAAGVSFFSGRRCGLSVCLQRGAENLPSGVTFLLRVTGDAMVDVDCIEGPRLTKSWISHTSVLHRHAGGSIHIAESRCPSFRVQTAGITLQLSP